MSLRSLILLALPFAATTLSAGTMWIDVTTGGTATAAGGSTNFPVNEPPPMAIDNNFYSKYLNFDIVNTGVIISGGNSTVPVTRMILATANDAAERDPASYTLEGSNDASNWTSISAGVLALPAGRNTTLAAMGNGGVNNQSLTFANNTAYSFYRVVFPTVKNVPAANSMQIAEISLLGLSDPGQDVLDLQTYSASLFGGSIPGANEDASKAIDNDSTTKYLNFGKAGTGLTLTTTGQASIITSLSLAHANDAVARDVTAFTLSGSNDGINFTDITTNQTIVSGMGLFEGTTVPIANTTAYRDYRFVVTGLRDAALANSYQFSELQLHGALVPEPGSAMLGLLALAGLTGRRHRR